MRCTVLQNHDANTLTAASKIYVGEIHLKLEVHVKWQSTYFLEEIHIFLTCFPIMQSSVASAGR